MFQTRISSDVVAHQTGLGLPWIFAPTRPGALWFATLSQLQSPVPHDLPVRIKTSLLLFDYQADDLSAATALIAHDAALKTHQFDGIKLAPAAAAFVADDSEQLQRPSIDAHVLERAADFSAACVISTLTLTNDVTLWLYCLASITARCRAGLDEYRITFETPSDWGEHYDITRRLAHWKEQLEIIWRKVRCRKDRQSDPRIDSALADCRDTLLLAENAFESARNRLDSLLHVRLKSTPEAIDDFLHGPARRFCLSWRRVSPDAVILRSEELPTPVAVRLFDGLADEFKHITFTATAPDLIHRFHAGCTTEMDYERLLSLMEPVFFSENIAPIAQILHQRPLSHLWRVRGTKVELLRFLNTTVKAFGLDWQIEHPDHLILLRGRNLSATAMTNLMHLLSERFPRLTFQRAKRPKSRKTFHKAHCPPSGYLEFLQWPVLVDRVETELQFRFRRWEKAFNTRRPSPFCRKKQRHSL